MEYVRETSVYDEFFDFILQRIDAEEIIAFTPSDKEQERASELLEKNSAGTITPRESSELDQMANLDSFLGVLKAKAFLKLSQK